MQSGECARGGRTRGDNRARDHDRGCEEQYGPWGIVEEASGAVHITFGRWYKTRDCIVDTSEAQWNALEQHEQADTRGLQITMDNGPERRGRRTQCLARLVPCAAVINQPIQLVS